MNFLKGKLQKYNEKKLKDALKEMKFHSDRKKQLETQLKIVNNDESKMKIKERIDYQNELIAIWKKNIEIINKQLKKFE